MYVFKYLRKNLVRDDMKEEIKTGCSYQMHVTTLLRDYYGAGYCLKKLKFIISKR